MIFDPFVQQNNKQSCLFCHDSFHIDITGFDVDLSQSTISPKSCEGQDALLILVHSAPDHKDFREVIRSTWAKGPHSKLVFLVGRSTSKDLNVQVHSEAEATNDILLYNKSDSYYDLTTKHIFGYRYILDIVSFFSGILFSILYLSKYTLPLLFQQVGCW